MDINWSVFLAFTALIITLLAGGALIKLLGRKPKLIAFFAHAYAFIIRDQSMGHAYTHQVAI